jgi:tetratricopeptide (TPR) repeat protein
MAEPAHPAANSDSLLWPFASVAAIFVWLLAPSVAWFDSGELAGAAVQLGVPHPTGFALFDLAGHALARLPLGPAAWRVHLLGALCGVAAVALVWRAWPEPGQPGFLQRALRPLYWLLPLTLPAIAMHMRAAEVYAPTWLVVCAALWAWQTQTAGRRVAWLALLTGLGAGIHVEAALLPGLATAVAWWQTPRDQKLRSLGVALLLLLLSIAALAYLPLAAARKPAFSWGDVRTFAALRDHLSALSIRAANADRIGHNGLGALWHLLWRDAKWLLPLSVFGAVRLERQHKLLPLAWLMAADALYSAFINPMGLRDDQAGLLVLLGLGLLAAHGLAALVAWRPRVLVLPALVYVGLHAALLLRLRPDADLRAGARLADRLLRDVPPGAVLLASSDHTNSACVWLQTAEGARPDSACLSLALLRDPRMLRLKAEQLDAVGLANAATIVEAGGPVAARLAAWLGPWRDRPIGWEPGSAAEDSTVLQRFHTAWPWTWLAPGYVDEKTRHADILQWLPALATLCSTAQACEDEPTLRHHLATATALLAATRMLPDAEQARQLLETAVLLADDDAKVLNNLAALEVQSHHAQRALELCQRALEVEPDYARAHRTAARAALFLGQNADAVAHARAYVAARPKRETQPWLEELASQVGPPTDGELRALLK